MITADPEFQGEHIDLVDLVSNYRSQAHHGLGTLVLGIPTEDWQDGVKSPWTSGILYGNVPVSLALDSFALKDVDLKLAGEVK
jgi:hypothetical protein